eukprot:5038586-Prymnesium_polylepis.1
MSMACSSHSALRLSTASGKRPGRNAASSLGHPPRRRHGENGGRDMLGRCGWSCGRGTGTGRDRVARTV